MRLIPVSYQRPLVAKSPPNAVSMRPVGAMMLRELACEQKGREEEMSMLGTVRKLILRSVEEHSNALKLTLGS